MELITLFNYQYRSFQMYTNQSYARSDITLTSSLIRGETYTITWDGVDYECVCRALTNSSDEVTNLWIGDRTIYPVYSSGETSEQPTGEPFYISHVPVDSVGTVACTIYTSDTAELAHRIGVYQNVYNGIVIRDPLGNAVTYGEYSKIRLNRANGDQTIFTEGEALDEVSVELDLSSGNQTIEADSGYLIKTAIIQKPETLIPENIISGIEIAGVTGSHIIVTTEETTVDLDFSDGDMAVEAESGAAFSKVNIPVPETLVSENIVDGVEIAGVTGTYTSTPTEEATVDLDFADGDMVVEPSSGKLISKVYIPVPETLVPENIAEGVTIAGVGPGTHSGGSGDGSSDTFDLSELMNRTISVASGQTATTIPDHMFKSCASLTSVSFPNCTSIGSYAFAGCSALSTVTFPSCTTMGSYAFYNCINLTSADIPNCTGVSYNTFNGCSALVSANFPNGTYISFGAFGSCWNLTTISMPNCTTLGSSAFIYCSSLTSVTFPSCKTVPTSAFYRCINLASVDIPNCTTVGTNAFYYCTSLTSMSLPECSVINASGFYNCYNMTNISFPSCKSIGSSAFAWCTNMSEANFPVCTSIGSAAFSACYALESANFPLITLLPASAFYKCSNLTTALFPNVSYVGPYAFGLCPYAMKSEICFSKVTQIANGGFYNINGWTSLPSTSFPVVSTIGQYAFRANYYLTFIHFPALKTIGSSAFMSCTRLETAVFPVCSRINSSAFVHCSSIKSVYLLSTSCVSIPNGFPFAYTTLADSTYTGTFGSIYVRESLLATYTTSTYWSTYSARFVGLTDDEITALGY